VDRGVQLGSGRWGASRSRQIVVEACVQIVAKAAAATRTGRRIRLDQSLTALRVLDQKLRRIVYPPRTARWRAGQRWSHGSIRCARLPEAVPVRSARCRGRKCLLA
jgi:hypothetical protein